MAKTGPVEVMESPYTTQGHQEGVFVRLQLSICDGEAVVGGCVMEGKGTEKTSQCNIYT